MNLFVSFKLLKKFEFLLISKINTPDKSVFEIYIVFLWLTENDKTHFKYNSELFLN